MFFQSRKARSVSGANDESYSKHKQALQNHLRDILAKEAEICNSSVLRHPMPEDGVYCPALFDGWGCFNHSRAGETAYIYCPPLPGFDTREMAFRDCSINGTWSPHQLTGRPWTNFSGCLKGASDMADVDIHAEYSHIYLFIAGASLSLILLIISLGIFFFFTQLRCDRVLIHQNLFISLSLSAISWILYYLMVVMDGAVLFDNPGWCQALHILCQYATTCNFSWMFCESLYLHLIMAYAMRTGKKLIKIIIACGWGVPLQLTIIYACVRGSEQQLIQECWVNDDMRLWIIAGPILLSVVLIVIMLINLVCLLVTKLQQIPDAPQSKKAVKAILILVPLFGLQFLLFPVRPEPGTDFYYIYLHVMAFLMSTQGTFVAVIFCFCNGEVRSVLRRKYHQHRLMRGLVRKNTALTSSTYADAYSAMDSTRDATGHRVRVHNDANTRTTDVAVELKPLSIQREGCVISADQSKIV